jgi:hypothetical protein
MKRILLTAVALLTLSATTGATAQVTIGSTANPQPFSILELDGGGTRGMRLPQLTTDERNALNLTGNTAALGLEVFNICTHCVETWNGTKWIESCVELYPWVETKLPVCTGMTIPPVRFAKYNLGADPRYDTPKKQIEYLATCIADSVGRIFGGRFQWGREWKQMHNDSSYAISVDGNYTLYSGTTKSVLFASGATYNANGQIITYNGTNIATGMHVAKEIAPYDWRGTEANQKPDLWGNGKGLSADDRGDKGGVFYTDGNYYQNTDRTISANDPCPDGFRVPTQDEWERLGAYDCNPGSAGGALSGITGSGKENGKGLIWVPVKGGIASATWGNSRYNYGGYAVYDTIEWNPSKRPGGYFYDASKPGNLDMTKPLYDCKAPEPLLFLPAAGRRECGSGDIANAGNIGLYWSSTFNGLLAYILYFTNGSVEPNSYSSRAYGFSIRCVVK